MTSLTYSIIVPMHNEEGNVYDLVAEIEAVMDQLSVGWELICINDGSTDATGERLQKLQNTTPHLIVITFKHNHGQSAALNAGFRLAKGKFVITLDGDRQNDPADIPKLLAASEECDLVCGYRVDRCDSWFRIAISRVANRVRRQICGDAAQDAGCSLKVLRTQCLRHIHMFDGAHRFLPSLFDIQGFSVREVPVRHRPRMAGKSKVHLYTRLLRPIVDMFAVAWMRKRHLRYCENKE